MLQKILVPLDGSELAESILPYVEEISQRCEPVDVILLRVIRPPSGQTGGGFRAVAADLPTRRTPDSENDVKAALHPVYREQEMASAKAEAEAQLAPLVERLCENQVAARAKVVFGRPAEAIVEFAEKEGVHLIALSTHGRSGFSRWLFGSVAEKVLRGTHLPLFLVRPPGLTGIPFPPQTEFEI